LKDSDKIVKNIGPFFVLKTLSSIAGKVTNASCLKDGTLLVEARNEKQAEVLLKATLLGSHPVHVVKHTSPNSSRGIFRTDSLDGISD
jgi:hypothetical protein